MNWLPYQSCCRQHATDLSAAFCPVCRHPLLRCHGYRDCHTLLEPQQPCPEHIALALFMRQDGLHAPQVGDRMNLPLSLLNRSRLQSGLRVSQVWRLARDGKHQVVELQWEKLAAGQQRAFSVDTEPLDSGGSIGVKLVLVIESDCGGQVEAYAFVGEIGLKVSREQSGQVIQNIHIEGSHIAAGGSAVLQTGPSLNQAITPRALPLTGQDAIAVPLERAEKFERHHGVRGYADADVQIPRIVELCCEGFPPSDAPARAQPFLVSQRIGLGRSRPGHHGPANSSPGSGSGPNFACLRGYERGQLLQDLSMGVSRHHFDLILRNGRLYLRTLGRGGSLNGGTLVQGETALLKHGDVFNPLTDADPRLDCRVDFACFDGDDQRSVERIALRRSL